jgi:pyrroline-5-carboxylate reductase
MNRTKKLALLGTGNIGRAIALGLAASERFERQQMILTRRRVERLADLAAQGFQTTDDNRAAIKGAHIVLVAVEPHQLNPLLRSVADLLDTERHVLISVVSGASIDDILHWVGKDMPVVRAMPNTAIALGQSMTCLCTNSTDEALIQNAVSIFDSVGKTQVIREELMVPATALCACGIAFFLRSVRAASQGGIEIGFHPDDAVTMAAQTALGAASLVLERTSHPEREIDSVTTPRGCTISGLNEMEHKGFSSALIKGIVTSAEKAASLYHRANGDRPEE